MLPNDLRELLLAFNAHEVEYLRVGGYAVGVYAEPRATKDMDLFVRPALANSEAVYRALAALGAPLSGVRPTSFCDDPNAVFQIDQPPLRIDILQQIDGVTFDEAWPKRVEAHIDGIRVHVISAEDLVRNKTASGRMQDLADAEAVREATQDR
jgi:predicted nucleotidyltransferase